MTYKLGILTSLNDDDAPELLRTIDNAISDGTIQAEVPIVFCDKKEGEDARVDSRIQTVRDLKHLNKLASLSPEDVDAERYQAARIEGSDSVLMNVFRKQYDEAAMFALPSADSFLNVGYMRIITDTMHDNLDIANLHPGIPKIGPIGMWRKVMAEQAERPLKYLIGMDDDELREHLLTTLNVSANKAGGMIHIVTKEMDRGPVIAWYEFPLTTRPLQQSWINVVGDASLYGIERAKSMPCFEELKRGIRYEQLKGEHPLLVLTYRNITNRRWSIKNKHLHINGREIADGYCLNRAIGEYIRAQGKETPIC